VEFNPIVRQSVEIDGDLDEAVRELPYLDLSKGNWLPLLEGSAGEREGDGDLSGKAWLAWDDEAMYLSAEITDDVYFASETGRNFWRNDSLQFAFCAKGFPPFTESDYHELGVNFVDGAVEMFRWKAIGDSAPNGGAAQGPIDYVNKPDENGRGNPRVAVKRNGETKTTVYEIAVPWQELAPLDPSKNEYVDFSLLVNDNDGAGRKGFMEWGSGIGVTKAATLFRNFVFLK
jgi:hypothetical protein